MKTKLQIILTILSLLFNSIVSFGLVPNLRTAANFVFFTSAGGVTNTGVSIIKGGAIGTDYGAITNFETIACEKYVQDAVTTQCRIDLLMAFNQIDSIVPTAPAPALPLSGICYPGVYHINSAVTLVTNFTLDAQNNPDAIFIFKITGAFWAAATTSLYLVNGAQAKNVFWNVDGAVGMGAGASMKGIYISHAGAIALGAGTIVEGRLLTIAGAISTYENVISLNFTPAPTISIIQPDSLIPTGTITVISPKDKKMTYSVDNITYTNTTGVFPGLAAGKYIVTTKDSTGVISYGTKAKIIKYINLGATASFALFTPNSAITSDGSSGSYVKGDVGTNAGSIALYLTTVVGITHYKDAISYKAEADLTAVFADLASTLTDAPIPISLGNGQILTPQVYEQAGATVLTGDLILDGQGNPNAQFVIKIAGALTTDLNSRVILTNSASWKNVFWKIDGATTLGIGSIFRGSLITAGAVIFSNNSTLFGRVISTGGALTLYTNINVNSAPAVATSIQTQPTADNPTGTISIGTPTGIGMTYSIDGVDYTNTTGVFSGLTAGTYVITSKNSDGGTSGGTSITIIDHPVWHGTIDSDWNIAANWSTNYVPTALHDVTIPNGATVVVGNSAGITARCKNLDIDLGAKLTITAANELIVSGIITNNAGVNGLIIKASSTVANGSLVFHNTVEQPVLATVEMYSKAFKGTDGNYKWQFHVIPVRSMVAYPYLNGSYIREMHENDTTVAHWVQLKNANVLTSFTGYEITQPIPKIINYQGALENGDYGTALNPIHLSYTDGASYPGEHLLGNSYAAAIDIKKLIFGSPDPTIIENTVYLYNTGSQADWTAAVQTDPYSTLAGQYTSAPVNLAGFESIPSQIPSMQAFIVKAKSNHLAATIYIPYSATGTMVKNTTMQRTSEVDKVCTLIDVKGENYADRMWIFSEQSCTHGFDNGWDGEKIIGSSLSPQLFAMEDAGNYQVNAVDDINNTVLGFQAGQDYNYSLTFTQKNTSALYNSIYLIDLLENTTTDISQDGTTYPFTASQTALPVSRFKIVTQVGITTDNIDVQNRNLKIFSSQKTIIIDNKLGSKGNLSLYDVVGRLIQQLPFGANTITTLPTNLPAGLYIVKSEGGDESISVKIRLL